MSKKELEEDEFYRRRLNDPQYVRELRELEAQLRALDQRQIAEVRIQIRHEAARLNDLKVELSALRSRPLQRPRVIAPTPNNPFSVIDISDQMAIRAERENRISTLLAQINQISNKIKELEDKEIKLKRQYQDNFK